MNSNCAASWKCIVVDQRVQCWRKQKELLNGENWIALPGPKQRNFNATDKSSRICAIKIKIKNMYPFCYQRVNVSKGNGRCYIYEDSVARFRIPYWLGTKICASQSTVTLAHKIPTDFFEKWIAYQHHIITRHWKCGHFLGRMDNAHEIPVLVIMLTSTTFDTKA